MSPDRAFDYVIVGAGTAGCIVAARLAMSGASVGLVEAGTAPSALLDIPLVSLWAWFRWRSRFCWPDVTVTQPALDGRRLLFPAGRLVGGSTAINAMLYSRGHRASFDRWALGVDPDWSFDALLPYFKRAEDQERGADQWHGCGGPIAVSDSRCQNEYTEAFLAGCREAGLPFNDDFNGPLAVGAGRPQVTQRNGRRATTAAYLELDEFRRVRPLIETRALRLLIEHGRATGVVCASGRDTFVVRAEHEVIVCAGVIRSPQLLMLSGIGPADELHDLGITVDADRPPVGRNLRDHLRVPLIRRLDGKSPARLSALLRAGVQYTAGRRGLLTSNTCDAAAVVRVDDWSDVPQIRVVFHWRVRPSTPGVFVGFEVALIDPASHGRVRLVSNDPLAATAIDPAYLSAPADSPLLVRGVELARAIAETAACREVGIGAEHGDGPTEAMSQIRRLADSAFHPVGTCRMGTDADSVVDTRLRVRGVDGLRVVDASVMPTTVAGNAQAAVMAIAERASDLIVGSA